MKIIGLEYPAFLHTMVKVDPHLKFTVQGSAIEQGAANYAPGVVEGFPSYPEKAPVTWKCYVGGQVYHKPCGHRAMELIQACLDAGAKTVWFEKISFQKPVGAMHTTKLMAKLQTKGISCKCPKVLAANLMSAIADAEVTKPQVITAAPTTPKVKPEPKPSLTKVKPLDGEPVTGESINVPKGLRPTQAAVTSLYVLVELDRIVNTWRKVLYMVHESSCQHRQDRWCVAEDCPQTYDPLADDLFPQARKHRHPGKPCEACAKRDKATRERANSGLATTQAIEQTMVQGGLASYMETWPGEDAENINVGKRLLFNEYVQFSYEYKATLARNLFDYLTLASVEEAKYNHGGIPVPSKSGSIPYDPRHMLPLVQAIFTGTKFSGGYGGPKWANIAKSAGYYFKFKDMPVVFADHVVDLSHNGGLAFNKGYILAMPSTTSYMAMLDHKAKGSLLDGKIGLELTDDVYTYLTRILSYERASQRPKVVKVVPDVQVPLVKWGKEVYEPSKPVPETLTMEATTSDDDQPAAKQLILETYPDSRRKAKGK